MNVPFFRPDLADAEIEGVVETLRSGWLTSGAKSRRFEQRFAEAVGARHAVAVNSCTAAMHLAVVALGLRPGDAVLVPTMTFAATAEVILYCGAQPILVDCHPDSLHLDFEDAEKKIEQFRAGTLPVAGSGRIVGILPVHVGGSMVSVERTRDFATRHKLWIVDDAAHTFPASDEIEGHLVRCGEGTADASCFSFYANKTITTGEGGMLVTETEEIAERVRRLALHGLSTDAWDRYAPAERSAPRWDYRIVEAGYKYNLTDIAAAIGLAQLDRADSMRDARRAIAQHYSERFAGSSLFETPPDVEHGEHAWHLYPIRLHTERLTVDRNRFVELLSERGVGFSVHWRPLHLHPFYESFGWRPEDLPIATETWPRLVSLPIFPTMKNDERDYVVETVLALANELAR